MTSDSEWFGEPHVLTVRSVRLPDGTPHDYGDLDYDVEHLPSCPQVTRRNHGVEWLEWNCELGWHLDGHGSLEENLSYSGTPVTEPGTYRIRSWGRKYYVHGFGIEHDGGIGLTEGEGDAS